MKAELVIFDMDGLMFDTERVAKRAWKEAGNKFGYKFEGEDCKSYTSGIVYASSYLGVNQGSSAKFDVTVPNSGKYKIRFIYLLPTRELLQI